MQITKNKNVDEMLSLLNSTLDAIDEGILVRDPEGNITFYNTKFLDIWSLTEGDIENKEWNDIISFVSNHLLAKESFLESVEKFTTNPELEFQDILKFKDGRIIERYSHPQILNGKIVGRVWSYKDITEIYSAEQKLSQEKDLLQALMDNIPDTIYFKDRNSKFTRINKAQAGLLGITGPKDAIGKTDFDFFDPIHAEDAFNDEQRIMESKQGLVAKVERIRKAGKFYIWVTATKVPIFDKDNNVIGLVGISRDITASKIDEEKLRKYSEELNELNKSKDKFFSILAHDLRSPLSPLLGLSQMLAKDFDTLSYEEIKEFSKDIYDAISSQFNLLENLLSWSRMETGKIKYNPVQLNIYEKVEEVIALLKGNARDKNILVKNSTLPDLKIFADKDMIHSILQNLISNAIKFTYPEGKINICSAIREEYTEITVEDNGVGIKTDDLGSIFGLNCFTTYGTNKEKGTGLGLAICKEMAERNGGTINVESEYQKGSKFIFSLPRQKDVLN